ncbi:MAG: ABC transporter substrate-binding protein [Treponema sp.]|jgi:ABC-type glycerol-3-phosphate transport system substrate-binding protein|nr:ABC transporter substrate-binding protein [Treponema sp.]
MKKGIFFAAMLMCVLTLGGSQSAISGIYRYSEKAYITFIGNVFTGFWDAGSTMSGTFSVSGSRLTLTITGGTKAGNSWVWTIIDANTIRDQDGDRWYRESEASAADRAATDKLVIWSFTDELGIIIKGVPYSRNFDAYFTETHPGVEIEYSQTPADLFQAKLDPVLASGQGVPDIISLERSFVRKYVESGLLLDITDIYEANKSRLFTYPAEVGTYNGRVYAMSWQACPGAMFYRRSLAKKYLGTDDPQVVQTYFKSFNRLLDTAELLKDKSKGACVVVSSLRDLANAFLSARRDPWVVNGRLVIDPAMEQYLDIGKVLHDNRWEGRFRQWSEGWFAGMRGELRDESGKPVEVFSYFLPTWGLHYVLKTNAPNTSGDWAMIQGPSAYCWGGTWIGAYKGARNAAAVKEFIRYATTDEAFLEAWAKETGDVVSNTKVVNKIKDSYREPYLGGQNHYAEFAEITKKVNGKLIQAGDEVIEAIFDENASAYWNGEKTKQQALLDFKAQTETYVLPSLKKTLP